MDRQKTTERYKEPARLEFSDAKPGDTIHLVTGQGEEAWRYDFVVETIEGTWPTGVLYTTMPDGTVLPPTPFTLHGCGRWTNRNQNPVQTQERAFSPYYDGLVEGSYFWGVLPGTRDRYAFDKPGQEITSLQLDKA